VADSCKGDDSDDIDYQYHKKFSEEDWKQDCRIFLISGDLLKRDSTFFLQWRSRIYSSPAKTV